MNIEKTNLGYDDILIEEESKKILDLNPNKKNKRHQYYQRNNFQNL